MKFEGHAKIIDECYIAIRITPNEEAQDRKAFLMMKESIMTPSVHELMSRAAMQLLNAGLTNDHLITFKMVIVAQEIAKDEI